jgi:hypothetical protein
LAASANEWRLSGASDTPVKDDNEAQSRQSVFVGTWPKAGGQLWSNKGEKPKLSARLINQHEPGFS